MREAIRKFWSFAAFMANSMIFLLLGLTQSYLIANVGRLRDVAGAVGVAILAVLASRALIVGLYDGSNEVQIDIPVTYQDGRKSQFRAQVRLHDVFGKADAGRGAVEEMRA